MRRQFHARAALTIAALGALASGCAGATEVHVRTADRSPGERSTAAPRGASGSSAPSTAAAEKQLGPGEDGPGEPVTIVFGGDIHYDGPLGDQLRRDPSVLLAGIAPAVESADVAVANLETAVGTGGAKATKSFNFLAPPEALDAITAAGIDVIGMANNHSLDFGQEGFAQTLAAIGERKAPVIGVGENEAAAYRPWTATVKGNRIAILDATAVMDSNLVASWTATATNPGVASAKRVDRLVQAVTEARAASDTVVVFLHWGTEKMQCPDATQKSLAPTLIQAGADVIVGTHAHRIQGGGFSGPAFIEYGLGNLQFKTSSDAARTIGLTRVTVDGRHVVSGEWLPARIDGNFRPQLLSGAAKDAAVQAWEALRPCTGLSAEPAPVG
ncbi:MAG: CapA family protein [Microthrixaceae bacterium]|jgi:poly-gamma-glutamate synthesis protein (capsule biosynthesis protein)|nr:CapA family protein [Actinomycetota bacterium]HMS12881.1 CapA family protein [Microthrixaceae bacterium]HMT25106.1 CapA family protein [Microthrixaceae bacterium]HMT61212.1 CapA family protein [Microthrixaceae bacterium]